MQIFKKEFSLNFLQETNLSSLFLLGVVIGNLFCSQAGQIPRGYLLAGFSILGFLCQSYLTLVTLYTQIIFLRFFLGISLGFSSPIPYVVLAEIIEVRYRAKFIYCLSFAYLMGKLYVVFLCFIFLTNFEDGNWRGLVFFSSIPLLISFLLTISLNETSAFLIQNQKFDEAFTQIMEECKMNGQLNQGSNGVLSSRYAKRTIQLWIILLITNNQIITINLLIPSKLSQKKFQGIIRNRLVRANRYTCNILFPGQSILGWQKNGSSSYFIPHNAKQSIVIGSTITKIVARSSFSTGLIFTSMSYDTSLRVKGSGIAQGIGKLFSLFSAPIFIYLFQIDPYLPFWYLGILAIIQFLTVWTIREN
ncbi:hypothetical protein pb186bvf_019979 [Paramecium bursaria]